MADDNTPAGTTPTRRPTWWPSGETLSKIAQKYYGDASLYQQIFEANRDVLKDPNKIFPGPEAEDSLNRFRQHCNRGRSTMKKQLMWLMAAMMAMLIVGCANQKGPAEQAIAAAEYRTGRDARHGAEVRAGPAGRRSMPRSPAPRTPSARATTRP